jgi:hypothetical protein
VNYWDEQMAEVMGEAMSTPVNLGLGRKTYDISPRIGRTAPTMLAPSP